MKSLLAYASTFLSGFIVTFLTLNLVFAQEATPPVKTDTPATPGAGGVNLTVPSFCASTEQIFSLLSEANFIGMFRGTYAQSAAKNKIIIAYNLKDPTKAIIVQQNEGAGISCLMMQLEELEVNRKAVDLVLGKPV